MSLKFWKNNKDTEAQPNLYGSYKKNVPQSSSNVNIECAGKSKLYSLWDQLLVAWMYQGGRGWGHTFFWKTLVIFRFFTLPLGNSRQNLALLVWYYFSDIFSDRYFLQNCKTITFGKIKNHTKYKKPNVPGHLYIFQLYSDKQIMVTFSPFYCWGNRFSKECCLGKRLISFCLWRDDKYLGASFEWGGHE